jgi:ribonucleoside-diphosphate reductase beta chain
MLRKPLFNPSGDDSLISRKIIGGNTTNLINLNNVKYDWALRLYSTMLDNFWRPEVISMNDDKQQYQNSLQKEEVEIYDEVLSFLIFLDSVQTNNLPNIAAYITAPEIVTALTVHAMQEAIHSQSYQYLIESVIPTDKREYIYDMWREKPLLFKRNSSIATVFQEFIDSPSIEKFFKVLIANYLLEGLYFRNGFVFFYVLGDRQLMNHTHSMIKYIKRDEDVHVVMFQRILMEIPDLVIKYSEEVYSLFTEALNQEINWSTQVFGNKVLGVTPKSIKDYTYFLANDMLKKIGLDPIFDLTKDPYSHLWRLENNVQQNFFERRVDAYNHGGIDMSDF